MKVLLFAVLLLSGFTYAADYAWGDGSTGGDVHAADDGSSTPPKP